MADALAKEVHSVNKTVDVDLVRLRTKRKELPRGRDVHAKDLIGVLDFGSWIARLPGEITPKGDWVASTCSY